MFAALFADRQQLQGPIYRARVIVKIQFLVRKNCAIVEKKVHIRLEKYTFLIKEECTSVHKKSTLFQKEMLKPFGLSIFFYRTKTILSTKILENIPTNTQRAYRKTPIFVAPNIHIQTQNILLPICNNITFKKQKPYFCNVKTPFLHDKNHTFVTQKPPFCFSLV